MRREVDDVARAKLRARLFPEEVDVVARFAEAGALDDLGDSWLVLFESRWSVPRDEKRYVAIILEGTARLSSLLGREVSEDEIVKDLVWLAARWRRFGL